MKLIYFMRPVGQRGPIKIGCSAMPVKRLENLARWSPMPLEIIACCKGEHAVERHLHKIFREQRAHSEWFNASPELEELIARINSGEPIVSIIGASPPNRQEKWHARHHQVAA